MARKAAPIPETVTTRDVAASISCAAEDILRNQPRGKLPPVTEKALTGLLYAAALLDASNAVIAVPKAGAPASKRPAARRRASSAAASTAR